MTGSLPLVALNCASFGRSQLNPRSAHRRRSLHTD
jgi:hypothetical protein